MIQATPVWETRSELGEAPVWWEGALYWLDVNAPSLFRYTPETGSKQAFPLAEKTGAVAPSACGRLVMAQETGLVLFSLEDQSTERLPWPPEAPIVNRFNDGKCDPQGRFWIGTLGRDRPTGCLYRIDLGGGVTKMLDGVRISNGLCWDERRGVFYYIDSPTRCIDAFDWDPAEGQIANRRTVAQLPEPELVVPDGMTIDTQGNLWVAAFGGYGVHCIDPISGRSLEKIYVPVRKTTSCCFGGDELGDLYITTASIQEDEASLRNHPLAGSLFVCQPDARGQAITEYAGSSRANIA